MEMGLLLLLTTVVQELQKCSARQKGPNSILSLRPRRRGGRILSGEGGGGRRGP